MYIEFEVKFYIDVARFHQLLQKNNAQLVTKNRLMRRIIFEAPESKNSHVRVRDEGDQIRLSYKSYDASKTIDSLQETDVMVDDFDKACEILTLLGLKKIRYVQNYRETFKLDDCLLMIDQWPALEPLVEIEGSSRESVEKIVNRLGFSMDNGMYGPTSKLYENVYGLSREQFEKIEILTFENVPNILKKTCG